MLHKTILVPGASAEDSVVVKDVTLDEGATVNELLEQVGLADYQLRAEDGEFLASSDVLTDDHGDKLYAVPKMEVGA